MDDAHILRLCRQQHVLVGLGSVALIGGDKAGSKLHTRSAKLCKMCHIGTGVHAARHEYRDGVAVLLLVGLYLGQHPGQNLVQSLAAVSQQVLLGKAEMSARLAALDDHKIGGTVKALCPAAQDELCRPGAGYDGRNGYLFGAHNARQLQRQTRTGDHGIHSRRYGGADSLGIVPGGYHGVDSYQTHAPGNGLSLLDLCGQGAVVGCRRVTGKIRLAVACIGGGDAPHAAAGCYRTGQPAQRDAYAHAALQNGYLQGLAAKGQHSAFSAAMRCLPPCHRSARMSATGRTSCSIPAT